MTTSLDTGLDTGRGAPMERIALVDLLDRLLAGGVVIAGDLVISVSGVDLVRVSLRALITTVLDETSDEWLSGGGGEAS
ncbi:gas vesicle protein [Actinomadura terrae]|uniref:gas vesicle protein n=1 Tax=Actinomadura terrae TaxID=604353 RepID=UPI001FA6C738|nr:gas vesicle protein [Actinomadura terrae]